MAEATPVDDTSGSETTKVGLPSLRGPYRGRRIGVVFARGWWAARNVDAHNVPQTGRVILAANHSGFADGPILIGMAPRPLHIMIKKQMFDSKIGWLFRWTGQIEVDRKAGRPALQQALGLLEQEAAVGIFPEGTRGDGTATNAQAGVAWLAVHSGAPVVPVAILGTRRTGESISRFPGFRRRMVLAYGQPVQVDPALGKGRAAVTAAMEQIGAALRAQVADAVARTGIGLPED